MKLIGKLISIILGHRALDTGHSTDREHCTQGAGHRLGGIISEDLIIVQSSMPGVN